MSFESLNTFSHCHKAAGASRLHFARCLAACKMAIAGQHISPPRRNGFSLLYCCSPLFLMPYYGWRGVITRGDARYMHLGAMLPHSSRRYQYFQRHYRHDRHHDSTSAGRDDSAAPAPASTWRCSNMTISRDRHAAYRRRLYARHRRRSAACHLRWRGSRRLRR